MRVTSNIYWSIVEGSKMSYIFFMVSLHSNFPIVPFISLFDSRLTLLFTETKVDASFRFLFGSRLSFEYHYLSFLYKVIFPWFNKVKE